MRQLTSQEIRELTSRPGVRKIAVENFLATMGHDAVIARLNLRHDSRLYKWNPQTVKAISDGIKLACKPNMKEVI